MSGKYQTYPAYKDSGVEWLGDVPEHWEIWKLSHAFEQIGSGTTPKSDAIQYYEGGTIAWVNTGDLNDGELFDCEKKVTELALRDCSSLKIFPENSLVIAMYGATIGKLALLRFDATVNQACCVFCESSHIQSKFLFYSFIGVRQHIVSLATGGGQPNISQDILRSLKLSAPDKTEQQKIAQFLDHETAKIDTLIEKQQRLIELLKEKRQAVISHAVTKGLNPNAPMKESGVEWLGDVPEGWVVTRAKFVSTIFVPQRNKPELNDETGVAWATMEDMKGTYIEKTKNYVDGVSAKIAGSKTLQAGAVIASCVGNFDVASINKIDVIINQQLQAFIPHSIKAEYLRETIGISKNYFELIGTAATLVYVNQQGFENLPVLVPTSDEQEQICEHIEKKCHEFQQLISFSEQAIELMQERRTALISAAVTGKIDVREWENL